jgi:hypothetical protein
MEEASLSVRPPVAAVALLSARTSAVAEVLPLPLLLLVAAALPSLMPPAAAALPLRLSEQTARRRATAPWVPSSSAGEAAR